PTDRDQLDWERLAGFVRQLSHDPPTVGRFIERPVFAAVSAVVQSELSQAERAEKARALLFALAAAWRLDEQTLPQDLRALAAYSRLLVTLVTEHRNSVAVEAKTVSEAALMWSYAAEGLANRPEELEAADIAVDAARDVLDGVELHVEALLRLANAL